MRWISSWTLSRREIADDRNYGIYILFLGSGNLGKHLRVRERWNIQEAEVISDDLTQKVSWNSCEGTVLD